MIEIAHHMVLEASFYRERERIAEMSDADMIDALSLEGAEIDGILKDVMNRAQGIDQYLDAFQHEAEPEFVNRQMRLAIRMGSVPFVAGLVSAAYAFSTRAASENLLTVLGVIILLSAVSCLLALAAVIHIAMESNFTNYYRARRAEAEIRQLRRRTEGKPDV